MHGGPTLLIRAPLQQRELDHPAQRMHVALHQPQLPAQLQPQLAQALRHDTRAGICHDEHQVAGSGVRGLRDGSQFALGQGLRRRARPFHPVRNGHEPFGAPALRDLGQVIKLLTAVGRGPRRDDRLDLPARGNRAGEDAEPALAQQIAQVHELHAEAQVRLVGAVFRHRFRVGQHGERLAKNGLAAPLLDKLDVERLDNAHDVLALDEGHLDVELRELGLAVRAQVLVAEAARNLEIPLKASDH